jgi:hypothetical protein
MAATAAPAQVAAPVAGVVVVGAIKTPPYTPGDEFQGTHWTLARKCVVSCMLHLMTDAFPPGLNVGARPDPRHPITPFHADRVPDVSVSAYFRRLVDLSMCSTEAIIIAWTLFVRLAGPDVPDQVPLKVAKPVINVSNAHRYLLTCFLVATKFFDDFYYGNNYWAKIGGVDTRELKQCEVLLLKLFDWDIARFVGALLPAQFGTPTNPLPTSNVTTHVVVSTGPLGTLQRVPAEVRVETKEVTVRNPYIATIRQLLMYAHHQTPGVCSCLSTYWKSDGRECALQQLIDGTGITLKPKKKIVWKPQLQRHGRGHASSNEPAKVSISIVEMAVKVAPAGGADRKVVTPPPIGQTEAVTKAAPKIVIASGLFGHSAIVRSAFRPLCSVTREGSLKDRKAIHEAPQPMIVEETAPKGANLTVTKGASGTKGASAHGCAMQTPFLPPTQNPVVTCV